MAFIRLPLGIRVSVDFTWNGKPVVNIYHVITPDTIDLTKLQQITNVFALWAENDMLGNMSVEIALTGVTALSIDVPNGAKFYDPVLPPIAGNVGGDSVSNNVAVVCSMYTALTGRSYRGRSYIPGMAELYVGQNDVDGAVATALVAGYVALSVDLAFVNVDLVVASFQTGGAPRAEGVATPVDSFAINSRVDTQRRRLPIA